MRPPARGRHDDAATESEVWPERSITGMPGEALLLGIATIAVAVAGFTAVTSTLVPPNGSWSPAMRIRQRAIVSTSFNVMFEALALLIIYAWLGDLHAALVVASAGVALYATWVVVYRGRQFVRAGGYRTRSSLVLFAAGPTATRSRGKRARFVILTPPGSSTRVWKMPIVLVRTDLRSHVSGGAS